MSLNMHGKQYVLSQQNIRVTDEAYMAETS